MIEIITEADYKDRLAATQNGVLLFFKKLCPHCKNMEKVLEKFGAAKPFGGKAWAKAGRSSRRLSRKRRRFPCGKAVASSPHQPKRFEVGAGKEGFL